MVSMAWGLDLADPMTYWVNTTPPGCFLEGCVCGVRGEMASVAGAGAGESTA